MIQKTRLGDLRTEEDSGAPEQPSIACHVTENHFKQWSYSLKEVPDDVGPDMHTHLPLQADTAHGHITGARKRQALRLHLDKNVGREAKAETMGRFSHPGSTPRRTLPGSDKSTALRKRPKWPKIINLRPSENGQNGRK